MMDRLHKAFFLNHPLRETWFHIIIALLIILFVYIIISSIIDKFSSKNKIRFNFIKIIIIGLAIPIIAILCWYNAGDINPIDEYLLITNSKTITGFITNAEEQEEYVETNDGRTGGMRYSFSYDYTFKLSEGKIFNSYGTVDWSDVPDDMRDLATKHYKVEVQYLPNKPEISRVKNFLWHNTTVYEWLRYNILLGIIVLVFFSYFGFILIKGAKKDYLAESKKLVADTIRLNE